MNTITIEQLYEHFDCNFKTGTLTRKANGRSNWSVSNRGYLQVAVCNRTTLVHRVIWAMFHGRMPVGYVDHIDLNPMNCRPSNLREATPTQNCFNSRRRSNNTTGFKGVYPATDGRGGFMAQIRVNYKRYPLGRFPTPELAHNAYCKRLAEVAGEFGRTA